MGRRTGNPRGAPRGNTNRLKHGRWGREFAAHKAEVDALLREARNAVIRANMVVRARRNLAKVVALKRNLPRPRFSGGEGWGEGAVKFVGCLQAMRGLHRPLTLNPLPHMRGGEGILWPNFYKTRAGPMASFAAQTIGT